MAILQARGAPRQNATAKDSEWVRTRQALEKDKPSDVNEVGAVRYCAVLCCAVLCCAVLCCAVLCCAVLCCAVLCCAVHEYRMLGMQVEGL